MFRSAIGASLRARNISIALRRYERQLEVLCRPCRVRVMYSSSVTNSESQQIHQNGIQTTQHVNNIIMFTKVLHDCEKLVITDEFHQKVESWLTSPALTPSIPALEWLVQLGRLSFNCSENQHNLRLVSQLISIFGSQADTSTENLLSVFRAMCEMKIKWTNLTDDSKPIIMKFCQQILSAAGSHQDLVRVMSQLDIPWETLSVEMQNRLLNDFIDRQCVSSSLTKTHNDTKFIPSFAVFTRLGWDVRALEETRRSVLYQRVGSQVESIIKHSQDTGRFSFAQTKLFIESVQRVNMHYNDCSEETQLSFHALRAVARTYSRARIAEYAVLYERLSAFGLPEKLRTRIATVRAFVSNPPAKTETESETCDLYVDTWQPPPQTQTQTQTHHSSRGGDHHNAANTVHRAGNRADSAPLNDGKFLRQSLHPEEMRLLHEVKSVRDKGQLHVLKGWLTKHATLDLRAEVHSVIERVLSSKAAASAMYVCHRAKQLNASVFASGAAAAADCANQLLNFIMLRRNIDPSMFPEYLRTMSQSGMKWAQLSNEHRQFIVENIVAKVQDMSPESADSNDDNGKDTVRNSMKESEMNIFELFHLLNSLTIMGAPVSALSLSTRSALVDLFLKACQGGAMTRDSNTLLLLVQILNRLATLGVDFDILDDTQKTQIYITTARLFSANQISTNKNQRFIRMESIVDSLTTMSASAITDSIVVGEKLESVMTAVTEADASEAAVVGAETLLTRLETLFGVHSSSYSMKTDAHIIGSFKICPDQTKLAHDFIAARDKNDIVEFITWLRQHKADIQSHGMEWLFESLLNSIEGVEVSKTIALAFYLYRLKALQKKSTNESQQTKRARYVAKIAQLLQSNPVFSAMDFNILLRGMVSVDVQWSDVAPEAALSTYLLQSLNNDQMKSDDRMFTDLLESLAQLPVHFDELSSEVQTAVISRVSTTQLRGRTKRAAVDDIGPREYCMDLLVQLGVNAQELRDEHKNQLFGMVQEKVEDIPLKHSRRVVGIEIHGVLHRFAQLSATYETCPPKLQDSIATAALRMARLQHGWPAAERLSHGLPVAVETAARAEQQLKLKMMLSAARALDAKRDIDDESPVCLKEISTSAAAAVVGSTSHSAAVAALLSQISENARTFVQNPTEVPTCSVVADLLRQISDNARTFAQNTADLPATPSLVLKKQTVDVSGNVTASSAILKLMTNINDNVRSSASRGGGSQVITERANAPSQLMLVNVNKLLQDISAKVVDTAPSPKHEPQSTQSTQSAQSTTYLHAKHSGVMGALMESITAKVRLQSTPAMAVAQTQTEEIKTAVMPREGKDSRQPPQHREDVNRIKINGIIKIAAPPVVDSSVAVRQSFPRLNGTHASGVAAEATASSAAAADVAPISISLQQVIDKSKLGLSASLRNKTREAENLL